MMPTRIQRKRTKGYKQPPGTYYCGRPGKFGNPYSLAGYDRYLTIAYFRVYVDIKLQNDPTWLDELRQYEYLSCFCRLDESCHVDVLIELLKVKDTDETKITIQSGKISEW